MEENTACCDWRTSDECPRHKLVRVFCPKCGELKLKRKNNHFEFEHPELDKILAKMLDNGFTTKYV